MLLLCSNNGLQSTLTATVFFMFVLSTRGTKECRLQLTEKMKTRSVVFKNIEMKLCQVACIDDSFKFATCRRSSDESKKIEKTSGSSIRPENHPRVLTEPCGSQVCNANSQCVDEGCKKICMDAPALCELHTASKTGYLSKVKLLLSQGQTDINCQEGIGRTPVMLAACGGHREMVELLVTKGAKLSIIDKFGINVLHSACLGGNVEVVKYILSQNILDINGIVSCGRTAVMLAAVNGHIDIVALLVDRGANLSLADGTGDNILHCACRGGDTEVVKYILSTEKVDINSRGHHKKTPVMLAREKRHKDIVKLLVNHGADPLLKEGQKRFKDACDRGNVEAIKRVLSQYSVDINNRGYMERTPVMIAAQRGKKEVVELLVKHGADLSLTEQSGSNILHNAGHAGRVEVVEYILSLNTLDINSRGYLKRTPAMVAADQGRKAVVELLVKHGADLSLRENSGSNILHLACHSGQLELVKYILSLNSVDINCRGWKKRTPAMLASREGRKQVVNLLKKHGADLSLRDEDGKNVLDLARQ